jgi:hypothetical protein
MESYRQRGQLKSPRGDNAGSIQDILKTRKSADGAGIAGRRRPEVLTEFLFEDYSC